MFSEVSNRLTIAYQFTHEAGALLAAGGRMEQPSSQGLNDNKLIDRDRLHH